MRVFNFSTPLTTAIYTLSAMLALSALMELDLAMLNPKVLSLLSPLPLSNA